MTQAHDCLAEVLPIRTASALYGPAVATLYLALKEGRLHGLKRGGVWMTTRTAMEEALAAGRLRPGGRRR